MKSYSFFLLLILSPFVLSSCIGDYKNVTGKVKTFKVKYEIVAADQNVSNVEVFGTYTEHVNNRIRILHLSKKLISDIHLITPIGKPAIFPENFEEESVFLPWSCETTSSNLCPPIIDCTSDDQDQEFILRIYIDGDLYKEVGPTSDALLDCIELTN